MRTTKIAYGALFTGLIVGLIFAHTINQQHSRTIIELQTDLNQTKSELTYYRRVADQMEDRIYEHEKAQALLIKKLNEQTIKYYSLLRTCMDTTSLANIKEYIIPLVENP